VNHQNYPSTSSLPGNEASTPGIEGYTGPEWPVIMKYILESSVEENVRNSSKRKCLRSTGKFNRRETEIQKCHFRVCNLIIKFMPVQQRLTEGGGK
jgi:glutaminase